MPTLDDFLDNSWERRPRLMAATIKESVADILTVDHFELLMAGGSSGDKSLSVVEDGIARPVVFGDNHSSRLPSIYAAYGRGCTLLLSSLELRWPSIARICRDVENQMLCHGFPLAERVGANAYLTPAGAKGFNTHYDNHCAIIIQLHGSKSWNIFPPLSDMPLARCERPIRLEDLEPPLIVTELMAGDVLYIPRGFPHCASTGNDSSLHITLSIRAVTWVGVIQTFCQSDSAFRRSVRASSWSGTSSSIQEHFLRDLLPRLGSVDVDLIADRLITEGLSMQLPIAGGGLRSIEASKTFTEDTQLIRTQQVRCTATIEENEAVLRFPGASLRLPIAMTPVFQFIATHEEFTPNMLPGIDQEYDRLHLTHILTERGLLQVKGESKPCTRLEAIATMAEAM